MILLDTGYLIALAKPSDSLHLRAAKWAERIREPLVVSEYVLCETVDALSVPPDRAKAHALVARLRGEPDCRIIPATSGLFEAGLRLHSQRSDKDGRSPIASHST